MSQPFSILFVDDEGEILDLISRILRGASFEVLTAVGGEEALAILRTRRVDVLVSDMDMPDMDGIGLLRRVRAEHPSTLRMVLTGAATAERALAAINEGEVVRMFSKPFEPTLFRATIESLATRIDRLRSDDDEASASQRYEAFRRWVDASYPTLGEVRRDKEGSVLIGERELSKLVPATLWTRLLG